MEDVMKSVVKQEYHGKPFLVDVPVSIHIWIRPECQKRQFRVLREARPSILFLISDGGRSEKEWQAIRENRKMYDEEIDWDCTVYKMYEPENLGMYAMGSKSSSLVWDVADRCIFLEDDVIPSVSFFRYCAELLERYKDDLRISLICGMNHLGDYQEASSDYFFSRQGSIWGFAMWRRTYEAYDKNFTYSQDPYTMRLLKQPTRHNRKFWDRLCGYAKDDNYDGHRAGPEFYFELSMYAQNQLQIVPRKNMICNMGAGADAAHSDELNLLPRRIRRIFHMQPYGLDCPLRHPRYVIPDVAYEKKRNAVMAYNNPWRGCLYWAEGTLLKIRRGYGRQAAQKILDRIRRKKRFER